MKKLAYLILSSSILLFGCRGVTNIAKNLTAKDFDQTTYVTISLEENDPVKFNGEKYTTSLSAQQIENIVKEGFKEKVEKLGATYFETMPENIPHDVLAYHLKFDVTLSEDVNNKKHTDPEKGYNNFPYKLVRIEVKGNASILDGRDGTSKGNKFFIINAREDLSTTTLPHISELSESNHFNNYIYEPSADFPTLSKRYGERIAIWLSKQIN